ncbi:MAG: tetratricopeptide repeat protein [Bdellovibrionales bacterium]
MKNIIIIALLIFSQLGFAQNKKKKKAISHQRQTKVEQADSGLKRQLSQALQLSQSGQYQSAAIQLFSLSRRSELQSERAQIKYILGLMLTEMGLNQIAAFQFVDVIRTSNPRYTKLAIDKLATVADELGDDTLINYAMSRVDLEEVPEANRDMVQFRIGEIKVRNKKFEEGIRAFAKIGVGSRYFSQALYQKFLAYLELGKPDQAIQVFQTMLSARRKAGVTDTNRVAAQLALARAYYQKKEWDLAVANYNEVPRDHFLWHEALNEQTWAMLRGARFRSVLSQFHSIHAPFYEDDYNPESLILRSIVYLYICKYDEMDKVISLFEKTYTPVRSQISLFLSSYSNPLSYFSEIEKWQTQKKLNQDDRVGLKIPSVVAGEISSLGSVRRSLNYLKRLEAEKKEIESTPALKSTSLGRYALKVIAVRTRNTKTNIGEIAKVQMTNMKADLKDYFEQASFARYEMIGAQKENIKKKIQGTDLPEARVDDNRSRDFYVQNGYQYYPFNGEYWLDEIGNYQFLGKSSCE